MFQIQDVALASITNRLFTLNVYINLSETIIAENWLQPGANSSEH